MKDNKIQENCKSFLEALKNSPLIFIIIVNLIIRLPNGITDNIIALILTFLFPADSINLHITTKSYYMRGNDDYLVIWMAQAIKSGWFEAWSLSPLSIFGLYPFSLYPIGAPLVISIFLTLGLSVDNAAFVFSILISLLATISSYKLGNLLFENRKEFSGLFSLFYSTSILFLAYSNANASVRGFFLALLPFTIYCTLNLFRKPTRRNLIFFLSSIFLLSLTHALIPVYSIYILSMLLSKLLSKVKCVGIRIKVIIFPVLYVLAFIFGIKVINVGGFFQSSNEVIFYRSEVSIEVITAIVMHNSIMFGILVLFGFFGFLGQLFVFIDQKEKESHQNDFFLILGIFLFFISPRIDYAILFMLPWICYYSIIFLYALKTLFSWDKGVKFIYRIYLVYLFFYVFFRTVNNGIIVITFFLALLILFYPLIEEKLKTTLNFSQLSRIKNLRINLLNPQYLILFLLFVTILFQPVKNTRYYEKSELLELSDYLLKKNVEKKLIFCTNHEVARAIAAYTFLPTLPVMNPPANLYYHYNGINSTVIEKNIVFSFEGILKYGTPFMYSITEQSSDYYSLFLKLLQLNLEESSDFERVVKLYDLGYILLARSDKMNNYFVGYNISKTKLIGSVQKVCKLVMLTENFFLYKLPLMLDP